MVIERNEIFMITRVETIYAIIITAMDRVTTNPICYHYQKNVKSDSSRSSGRESHCHRNRGGGSITFNLMLSNFQQLNIPVSLHHRNTSFGLSLFVVYFEQTDMIKGFQELV